MPNFKRSALAAMLAATGCAVPFSSASEVDVLQLHSPPDSEYQAILVEDDEAGADFFANPLPVPIVREYYHARLDRYFLTATQREKDDLDSGRTSGWIRTGNYFRSLDTDSAYGLATVPVCRYYLPPPLGDTHFFSAFAEECEAIARQWPAAILETSEAFRVALPDPMSGLCIPTVASEGPRRSIVTVPLYRVWNGRADANHRYTTNLADQSDRVRHGWIPEGFGPHGAAMCVNGHDIDTSPVPGQRPKGAVWATGANGAEVHATPVVPVLPRGRPSGRPRPSHGALL